MSLFERIKTINEKKYLPNTPNGKKNLGNNISDKIRRIGGYRNLDPERQFYGSKEQDYAKGDRGTSKGTKPQFRPDRTAQGVETTSNIKKGSIPKPTKPPKPPTILPPAGTDTEAFFKKLKEKEKQINRIQNKKQFEKEFSKPGITKSKGSDASTGGKKNPVVNPKNKGIKPTTVSTTKTVKQSDISKQAKKFTSKINKANVNRKEFDYAKSKEVKKFKGTVTQGPDKGRSYTIDRNPGPKGSRKGIPINKPKDIPIEKSNRAIGDLFRRYGRGEPKATQFMIDLGKDDRIARGLGLSLIHI